MRSRKLRFILLSLALAGGLGRRAGRGLGEIAQIRRIAALDRVHRVEHGAVRRRERARLQ